MAIPDAVAAIDIGTNSIHMLVARVAANGRFEVVTRQKEIVRLGSGQGEMKVLQPDAMDRGLESLRRCRSIADSFGADVYAVATSAVREALNAGEFIERAIEEAGIDVEVISGHEEARLIQLGILQALPVYDRPIVMIDVGGGSTEILYGRSGQVDFARSIKLGSLRMTSRFFPDGVVVDGAVERCRRYVAGRLAPIGHETRSFTSEVAVASSGTAETLAAMIFAARGDSLPQSLNAATVTTVEITQMVDLLGSVEDSQERRRLPGMEASRSDILLGGAIVLEQMCLALAIDEVTISEYALREGVLLDAIDRSGLGAMHHLADLRRSSVFHLMEVCDDDPEHSLQVARLSLQLFDALGDLLGLSEGSKDLLEAAAMLCNVGLFISHAGHHKHTYYVIRNSEHLMGYTDREIELIAQIARYHRKSAPSEDKHPEFAALNDDDRRLVRCASALLRVAVGMDRNHEAAVEDLEVAVKVDESSGRAESVKVTLKGRRGADLSLEQYSASSRSVSLSKCLGVAVEVVA